MVTRGAEGVRRARHTSYNKVCCRLRPPAAAFDPTGLGLGEDLNSVAWLREQHYFSRDGLAGSATARTLTAIGYGAIGIEIE